MTAATIELRLVGIGIDERRVSGRSRGVRWAVRGMDSVSRQCWRSTRESRPAFRRSRLPAVWLLPLWRPPDRRARASDRSRQLPAHGDADIRAPEIEARQEILRERVRCRRTRRRYGVVREGAEVPHVA